MSDIVIKKSIEDLKLLTKEFKNKIIYFDGVDCIKLWYNNEKGVSISFSNFNPANIQDNYYKMYRISLIKGDLLNNICNIYCNIDIGYEDVRYFNNYKDLIEEIKSLQKYF